MAEPTTRPTDADVTAFLDAVPEPRRRAEGHAVRELMERVTGAAAVMWGPSMVGFGSRPYTNTTGTHEWFVVGFSPRRAAMTLYGVYEEWREHDPLLDALGPHTTGKGCLYLRRLEKADPVTLEALVRQGWERGNLPAAAG